MLPMKKNNRYLNNNKYILFLVFNKKKLNKIKEYSIKQIKKKIKLAKAKKILNNKYIIKKFSYIYKIIMSKYNKSNSFILLKIFKIFSNVIKKKFNLKFNLKLLKRINTIFIRKNYSKKYNKRYYKKKRRRITKKIGYRKFKNITMGNRFLFKKRFFGLLRNRNLNNFFKKKHFIYLFKNVFKANKKSTTNLNNLLKHFLKLRKKNFYKFYRNFKFKYLFLIRKIRKLKRKIRRFKKRKKSTIKNKIYHIKRFFSILKFSIRNKFFKQNKFISFLNKTSNKNLSFNKKASKTKFIFSRLNIKRFIDKVNLLKVKFKENKSYNNSHFKHKLKYLYKKIIKKIISKNYKKRLVIKDSRINVFFYNLFLCLKRVIKHNFKNYKIKKWDSMERKLKRIFLQKVDQYYNVKFKKFLSIKKCWLYVDSKWIINFKYDLKNYWNLELQKYHNAQIKAKKKRELKAKEKEELKIKMIIKRKDKRRRYGVLIIPDLKLKKIFKKNFFRVKNVKYSKLNWAKFFMNKLFSKFIRGGKKATAIKLFSYFCYFIKKKFKYTLNLNNIVNVYSFQIFKKAVPLFNYQYTRYRREFIKIPKFNLTHKRTMFSGISLACIWIKKFVLMRPEKTLILKIISELESIRINKSAVLKSKKDYYLDLKTNSRKTWRRYR